MLLGNVNYIANNNLISYTTALNDGDVGDLYAYNQATNSYVTSTAIAPYVGYWLYSTEAATLQVPAP